MSGLQKRPKLIASDLDGTVVAHYGAITERTIKAFRRAHEMGIHIYFVTGRPPRWMPEIKEAFGFGTGICGNGALLFDIQNHKVLEEWLIPIEAQVETVKRLRKAIPPISFAVETHDNFHREVAYIPKWDVGIDNKGVTKIEEAITVPMMKMLARCSDYEFTSDEMLAIATKEVGDLVNVTHSNPKESLLEISAHGVSKGATLAKIAERLGLTADDCVSFGDNPNDFSMLSWTSRSWAMADGHPDARKYAKSVALPHQEDGVAIVIEELLELPA